MRTKVGTMWHSLPSYFSEHGIKKDSISLLRNRDSGMENSTATLTSLFFVCHVQVKVEAALVTELLKLLQIPFMLPAKGGRYWILYCSSALNVALDSKCHAINLPQAVSLLTHLETKNITLDVKSTTN
jgi:hypothetical protein